MAADLNRTHRLHQNQTNLTGLTPQPIVGHLLPLQLLDLSVSGCERNPWVQSSVSGKSQRPLTPLTRWIRHWVRGYFSGRCRSMKCDNNFTESFNAWILEFRFHPIVTLLECVRQRLMERIEKNGQCSEKWADQFSPNAITELYMNKIGTGRCKVVFNEDDGYEVNERQDRHVVSLATYACTCRYWDLTGIPCTHACSALFLQKKDLVDLIFYYYHNSVYKKTYMHKIKLVRGRHFWKVGKYKGMKGPSFGRPRYKRRKDKYTQSMERSQKLGISRDPNIFLPKFGQIQKCSLCNEQGHNARKCVKAPLTQQSQSASSNEVVSQGVGTARRQDEEIVMINLSQLFKQPTQQNLQHPLTQQSQVNKTSNLTMRDASGNITYKRTSQGCGVMYKEDGIVEFHFGTQGDVIDEDTHRRSKGLPIPNEITYRFHQRSEYPSGSRRILRRSYGHDVPPPSNLPFEGPMLKWRGETAVSTGHLQQQVVEKARRMQSRTTSTNESSFFHTTAGEATGSSSNK